MICMRLNCKNTATHKVVLKLFATPGGKGAISTPVVFVCDEHSKDLKVDDVMDDQGWRKICSSFLLSGYQQPKRELTEVHVLPLAKVN